MATLWDRLSGELPPHDAPFLAAEPAGGQRCLAVVVAYEGGGFAGWQLQPGKRTVQEVLEGALSQLCDHPVRAQGSGRTDAGVHALGQVASFTTTSRLSLERMGRGLASLLPADVCLRALGPVPAGFHARFDCRAKSYEYWLWPRAGASLFLRHRLWPLREGLDLERVERALAPLRGEVDLRAFASRLGGEPGDTVRTMAEASVQAQGPLVRVRLTGSGFLRHVVRNLVGALAQVGSGRLAPGAVAEMLAAGRRLYAGPKAPAGGLYLSRVFYGEPGGKAGGEPGG
jgi:tRNA pseudouridine38-40 synthase